MNSVLGFIYEHSPEFIRNKIKNKVPRFIMRENGLTVANISFETLSGYKVSKGDIVNIQNIYRITSKEQFASNKCFIHKNASIDYYIGSNTEVLNDSRIIINPSNKNVDYQKTFLIQNNTQINSDVHVTLEHNEDLFVFNKSWLEYDNHYIIYVNVDFKEKLLVYMDGAYMDFGGYGLNSVVFSDLNLYNYNNRPSGSHAFLDFRKNLVQHCNLRVIRMSGLYLLEKKHKKFIRELYASTENM